MARRDAGLFMLVVKGSASAKAGLIASIYYTSKERGESATVGGSPVFHRGSVIQKHNRFY